MAKQGVTILGLPEIGKAFRELGQETSLRIARNMTNEAAQLVKFVAIDLAGQSEAAHLVSIDKGSIPIEVQPGNLKRNIVVKRVAKTNLTSEHIVVVRGKRKDGYAARYGRLLEHGTVKMAPKPFLRPALANNVQAATQAMKVKGSKMIEAAARRIGNSFGLKGTK